MKSLSLLIILFFATQPASAQLQLKVYFERANDSVHIYADNGMLCPVSLKLMLDKTNMDCSPYCPDIVAVPQNASKYKLVTLSPSSPKKATKFSYKYQSFLGDVTKADYDKEYNYYLPFEKSKEYLLFQGYKGVESHKNQNAIDFTMPEGSNITAAREGKVIRVVQNHSISCTEERCKEFNNSVTVYHSDGTFAEYAHIKQNGSLVAVGDVVKAGQAIAKSGNTGWSTGPHLHFVVYRFNEDGMQSLETKFKNGNSLQFLKAGERYTRTYD